jgi:3'(2'), 5'-bisphosphate nucleotidase
VMDDGDAAAHHFLVQELAAARPDDAILSEEGLDSRARLSAERVWIIDPLDGTNEFGEPGRSDWAVHVALVTDGRPIAAAVSLPAIRRVFATDPPPAPPPPLDGRRPRVVMSRSRAPHASVAIAQQLGAELVRLGSAGAKTMAVVTGEADIYAHAGGMYEWDSCAPTAVAAAAGLHVSRIDGSPLRYNRPDPWLPDLLVCRPELAAPVLEALWK